MAFLEDAPYTLALKSSMDPDIFHLKMVCKPHGFLLEWKVIIS